MIELEEVSKKYGLRTALERVSLRFSGGRTTVLIGPSGCGKSTLLRWINRMNDSVDGARAEGLLTLGEVDVLSRQLDVVDLRRRVGMVFQKPNPFPKSIYENVAYGCRIQGINQRAALEEIVERSLRSAALWDEVKDRLGESALQLSGGQQQRLCIARAIAVEPEVILLDEPCSALDPVATAKIEELMQILKDEYTLVIVTHNMQQASRVSEYTAFLYLGELIEYGETERLFIDPAKKQTEDYITGRFG